MSARARARIVELARSSNVNTKFVIEMFDLFLEAVKEELAPKDQTFQEFFGLEDKQPQLIQGYTAEQWQEIIDGGYLCEFGFPSTEDTPLYAKLTGLTPMSAGPDWFSDGFNDFQFCRPAQIKGVMRPIFVEPEDKKNSWFTFYNNEGKFISQGRWYHHNEEQSDFEALFKKTCNRLGITKYIEV